MQMIVEIVRKDPGIHIERIQVTMALMTGLTKKRVSEYVMELVDGGLMSEEDTGFRLTEKR